MALDRTGEPVAESARFHDSNCHRGWLGYDDEGRPIPCFVCRPHLRKTVNANDFAERVPSARAQQAIERENRE